MNAMLRLIGVNRGPGPLARENVEICANVQRHVIGIQWLRREQQEGSGLCVVGWMQTVDEHTRKRMYWDLPFIGTLYGEWPDSGSLEAGAPLDVITSPGEESAP